MMHAHQIREVAAAYLADGDAKKFSLDVARVSFEARQHGSAEAQKLVAVLQDQLTLLHGSHGSKAEFRRFLRDVCDFSAASNSYIGELPWKSPSLNQFADVEEIRVG